MTLLHTLPAELVLKVAGFCPSMPTLLALARTCRAAQALLLSEPTYAAYGEGSLKLSSHQLRAVVVSGCKAQRAKLARARSLHVTEPSILDHALDDEGDSDTDSDLGDSDREHSDDEQQARSRPPERRDSACVLPASNHPPVPTRSTPPLATWSVPILHLTFASTPQLTSLDLSRTSLTSATLHILLPLVPRVTHLSISQCPGITASAAQSLARHPTPFVALDVSWTRIHGSLASVLGSGVLDKVRRLKLIGLIGIPGESLVKRISGSIRELDIGYSAGVSGRDLLELAKHVKARTSCRKVCVNVDRCMGGGSMIDSRVIQQVHASSGGMVEVTGWQPPASSLVGAWKGGSSASRAASARSEAVFSAPRVALAVYMARRDAGATGMASPAV